LENLPRSRQHFVRHWNGQIIPIPTNQQIQVHGSPSAVLTAEAERAIELLQERRTALISAAVTGKIDVREFTFQERI